MNPVAFFQLLAAANGRMTWRRVGALRQQSRLMVAVIGLFVAGYWVIGYWLFYSGFVWVSTRIPGVGTVLLDRMVFLFFAFLLVMLFFSNMIIGYSTLFKNAETQWMLTLPVRAVDVFHWKLLETAVLASWAFLFLSAPFLLAYGSVRGAPGLFYVEVFLALVPFAVIASALGVLGIMLVIRYLHRRVLKWALLVVGVLVIAAGTVLVRPVDPAGLQQAQLLATLNELLRNSRVAVQPMLPSYWVARSMMAWSDGAPQTALFYFLVLTSNALMATLLCVTVSRRLFADGWSRYQSQERFRLGIPALDRDVRLPGPGLLERALEFCRWLAPGTRALVVKDVRIFLRDASQWSQFAIFFGLLGLYVLNLRSVSLSWSGEYWAGFLALLNLSASSMTLGTLTTRFVFPQFSLEGRRLWIVGMSPYGLRRLLLEKFWLSSICSMAITLALMLASSAMLQLPAGLTLLFASTVALMSFALCGIAVGIGALFPNLGTGSSANRQEDNPARIVSGFGGTFCFLLSLVYIALVIAAEAMPIYARVSLGLSSEAAFRWTLVGAWAFVLVVSVTASWLPMALALRRVEKLEI